MILHKIPDVKPKTKEKGILNILISKKYFQIALLYIFYNKFHFGDGLYVRLELSLMCYIKRLVGCLSN